MTFWRTLEFQIDRNYQENDNTIDLPLSGQEFCEKHSSYEFIIHEK